MITLVADVDTGVDDALALLYLSAHPGIDLRAVTCVAGNTGVDQVVRNTLDVLAAAGATDVPVARGAERPLVNQVRDAHSFHGENGLGNVSLEAAATPAYDGTAVELLRDVVAGAPAPVTLLGLGPLTNVALFLRAFPEQARALERIVFMGGSIGVGNATSVAEFNAWHDPEALAVVVDSGVPVTMYGLDVFYQPVVDPGTAADLGASSQPAARLAGQLLDFATRRDLQEGGQPVDATIGDAGAAVALTHPDLMTVQTYPLLVELAGHGRGQTLVDRRTRRGESEVHGLAVEPSQVTVVTELDGPAVTQAWLSTVTGG